MNDAQLEVIKQVQRELADELHRQKKIIEWTLVIAAAAFVFGLFGVVLKAFGL